MLPDVIDNAKTAGEITQLFQKKYKEIYTSVPTNDEELNLINKDINNLIRASNENKIVIFHQMLLGYALLD